MTGYLARREQELIKYYGDIMTHYPIGKLKAKKTEQAFNKKVQDLVEANGGYIIKTITTNKAGVHDMLACINGRFCSLEGKLTYNKMSKLQVAHRNKVVLAGGLAMEIKTLDDVLLIIHRAMSDYIQKPEPEDQQLNSFSL